MNSRTRTGRGIVGSSRFTTIDLFVVRSNEPLALTVEPCKLFLWRVVVDPVV